MLSAEFITKTRLFKYIENFTSITWKVFIISAQNIDCTYSLEPPRLGGSNEYPVFMFLSRNKKNKVYPEAVLTSSLNLCFWAEIRKIMYTPLNPNLTI